MGDGVVEGEKTFWEPMVGRRKRLLVIRNNVGKERWPKTDQNGHVRVGRPRFTGFSPPVGLVWLWNIALLCAVMNGCKVQVGSVFGDVELCGPQWGVFCLRVCVEGRGVSSWSEGRLETVPERRCYL